MRYIGERYITICKGEWTNTISYEHLVLVSNNGSCYISKKPVPIGIDITDTNYWFKTFDANETITQLQNEVNTLTETIATLSESVTNLQNSINTIDGNITTINNSITTIEGNITTINNSITDLTNRVTELESQNVTQVE